MSRFSSSTYSSICFLLLLHFVWLLLLTTSWTPGVTAKPTTNTTISSNGSDAIVSSTDMPPRLPKGTTGYTSIMIVGSSMPKQHVEFDTKRNEAEATKSEQVKQIFVGLLQLQGPHNVSLETDDAPVSERNTLDDDFGLDEQHESSTQTPDAWPRVKLAIPVLEPVKHLLNAVGGGDVNDTHVRSNSHRLIGHHGVHHAPHGHRSSGNESSAIETEEDRETAIDSTSFNLLETLGTAGTVLLGMLQNLRKLFAASAGNASSAFSGGGGGGGGGGAAAGDGGGQ